MIYQATGLCDLLTHLFFCIFTGIAHGHNILYRKLATAGWCHWAVTICNVIGVHHFSHSMGSNGNTAANVADDQVHVLIFLALLCCKTDADLLLI